MDAALFERARAGLQAWQDGDLSALEELLDPDVKLFWWQPGSWDCHNRHDGCGFCGLGRRKGSLLARVELIDVGDERLVSVSTRSPDRDPDWPEESATVITFRHGRVVHMQQYRSRAAALSAVGIATPRALPAQGRDELCSSP